jgi:hypothetical protein
VWCPKVMVGLSWWQDVPLLVNVGVVDFDGPTIAFDMHFVVIAGSLGGHPSMPSSTHSMLSCFSYATTLRTPLMLCANMSWMEPAMSMKENVPQTFGRWHALPWSHGSGMKTWIGTWWSLLTLIRGLQLCVRHGPRLGLICQAHARSCN